MPEYVLLIEGGITLLADAVFLIFKTSLFGIYLYSVISFMYRLLHLTKTRKRRCANKAKVGKVVKVLMEQFRSIVRLLTTGKDVCTSA